MLIRQSQLQSKRLIAMENKLRKRELHSKTEIQKLLKSAYNTFNKLAFERIMEILEEKIEVYDNRSMREPDSFRPYCPPDIASRGSIRVIDQIDGLPVHLDHNNLLTGLAVIGAQGSGKSSEIISLCKEIRKADPAIVITIIDPKAAFSRLAGFRHLDLSNASFDLQGPPQVSDDIFIYELMPILSSTIGLIYGLDILNQAAEIAISQREQYRRATGKQTQICLRDIAEALNMVSSSGFKKSGYKDAAQTGFSLILGRQNLFSCRKGISLETLFSGSTVINARSLTDDMQCRFFAVYLLHWLYQRSRYSPETSRLRHLLIIDDASRFVGTSNASSFDGRAKTSGLAHILATIRSSGTALAFATQLPAQVDPSLLTLTRNALVIGNITGRTNLQLLQGMLSLTTEQMHQLTWFKKRESLLFASGHQWKYLIHGKTPDIDISSYLTSNPAAIEADITPWQSLSVISIEKNEKNESKQNVCSSVERLVLDCLHYPFSKASEHASRLGSVREYDSAKLQATQAGLLISSQCGQRLYLIPSQAAYDKFKIVNPYKRAASIEHAFYVRLAEDMLKRSGFTVKTETPIGAKGATIDLTVSDKSGNMTAIELTLSTSNLSSNASKLQDSSYQTIVWLCRDADTVKAVRGYFNKCKLLPGELIARFEYIHLSKWIREMEKK